MDDPREQQLRRSKKGFNRININWGKLLVPGTEERVEVKGAGRALAGGVTYPFKRNTICRDRQQAMYEIILMSHS